MTFLSNVTSLTLSWDGGCPFQVHQERNGKHVKTSLLQPKDYNEWAAKVRAAGFERTNAGTWDNGIRWQQWSKK